MERFANEKIAEWRIKHIDPVMVKALNIMSSLLTTAEQNFTGYCGLIPEVGGLICSQFAISLHMTWDWIVRPELMSKATELFTQKTASVVKKARRVMEAHIKALLQRKSAKNTGQQYGEIGKTLNQLVSKCAMTIQKDLKDENAYRANLRALLTRVNGAQ